MDRRAQKKDPGQKILEALLGTRLEEKTPVPEDEPLDSEMDDKSRAKLCDFLETYLNGQMEESYEDLEYNRIRRSLSVVLEYFFSPNREYTPCSTDLNLYDNETIKGHKFQTAYYTPNCWFDSAVPFGFSNGATNVMLDVMYMKDVSVNPHEKDVYPALQDTPLWPFISSIIKKKEVSKSVSVGGVSPLDDYRRSLSKLCRSVNTSLIYDEAPLFRILLLLDCLQSPECHDRYDYTVQNLFFQSYGFTNSLSWLQEINDTNRGFYTPGLNSSNIQCVTLSYYTKFLSGSLKYVVIPVSQAWSGYSWLFPYIASFTTTAWWNFGLVLRTQILDSTTGQPYGNDSILSFPEASTVHVPGKFENILLVLIDSESISEFFVGTLKIPLTKEEFDDPVNFSLPFYKYLGRHGAICYPFNVLLNSELTNDAQKAMACIIDTVCMPGVLQRCISMVSETCRMRYHNNWVIPSRNPLKKEPFLGREELNMVSVLFNPELLACMQKSFAIEAASDDELLSMGKSIFGEKTEDISQAVNSKLKARVEDEPPFGRNYSSGPGYINLMAKFRPVLESLGHDYASFMQMVIEGERSELFSGPVILNLESVSYKALDSDACDSETLANPTAFKNFLRRHGTAEMINIIKEDVLESEKKRQICRYFTPMMNLTGKQQKIGDLNLPLVSALSYEHLPNLKIAAFSRVSPMHVIPSSCAKISKIVFDYYGNKRAKDVERGPMPCFYNFKSRESQYNITEAGSEARILIALSRRNKIEKVAPIYAPALTLEMTRFASICGAVAEWTISSFGINFFDMNKLTQVSNQHDCQNIIDDFWPSNTHNFISRPMSSSSYFVTEIISLIRQKMNFKNFKINQLHGGLLPWWYVCAVAKRFKCGPIAHAKDKMVMLPGDFENAPDLDFGYIFTSMDPWYTLPFYTANNQYDHPMFQNYYMLYNGRIEPVAWYPDAYVDATRLTQSLRLKSSAPEQPKYFCEILTTPLETNRQDFNKTFVSYSCPSHKMKEDFIPVLDDMLFLGVNSPPQAFVINFFTKKLKSNTNSTTLPETKPGPSKKTSKGSKSSLPKGSTSSKK